MFYFVKAVKAIGNNPKQRVTMDQQGFAPTLVRPVKPGSHAFGDMWVDRQTDFSAQLRDQRGCQEGA
jgi:hypothetical protein